MLDDKKITFKITNVVQLICTLIQSDVMCKGRKPMQLA